MKRGLIVLMLMTGPARAAELPPADESLRQEALSNLNNRVFELRVVRAGMQGAAIGAAAQCGANRHRLDSLVGIITRDAAGLDRGSQIVEAMSQAMSVVTRPPGMSAQEYCNSAVEAVEDIEARIRRDAQERK